MVLVWAFWCLVWLFILVGGFVCCLVFYCVYLVCWYYLCCEVGLVLLFGVGGFCWLLVLVLLCFVFCFLLVGC